MNMFLPHVAFDVIDKNIILTFSCIVPEKTYKVLGGTLNFAHSTFSFFDRNMCLTLAPKSSRDEHIEYSVHFYKICWLTDVFPRLIRVYCILHDVSLDLILI